MTILAGFNIILVNPLNLADILGLDSRSVASCRIVRSVNVYAITGAFDKETDTLNVELLLDASELPTIERFRGGTIQLTTAVGLEFVGYISRVTPVSLTRRVLLECQDLNDYIANATRISADTDLKAPLCVGANESRPVDTSRINPTTLAIRFSDPVNLPTAGAIDVFVNGAAAAFTTPGGNGTAQVTVLPAFDFTRDKIRVVSATTPNNADTLLSFMGLATGTYFGLDTSVARVGIVLDNGASMNRKELSARIAASFNCVVRNLANSRVLSSFETGTAVTLTDMDYASFETAAYEPKKWRAFRGYYTYAPPTTLEVAAGVSVDNPPYDEVLATAATVSPHPVYLQDARDVYETCFQAGPGVSPVPHLTIMNAVHSALQAEPRQLTVRDTYAEISCGNTIQINSSGANITGQEFFVTRIVYDPMTRKKELSAFRITRD